MHYTIGQFSKATGLTIKAIRLYHEMKLLVPSQVDPDSGYRYFDQANVGKARAIALLREMQFSLDEIAELLDGYDDEAAIIGFLERKRADIARRVADMQSAAASIDQIIVREKAAHALAADRRCVIEEKQVAAQLVASIRWRGRYSDAGTVYPRLGRAAGLAISGKPVGLYYDMEYLDDGADIEACMPVRRALRADGVDCRQLDGGRFVTLLHCGPYDQLHRSYARLFDYLRRRQLPASAPIRELYHKGPGMIFRGNPMRYLTEIQFCIAA